MKHIYLIRHAQSEYNEKGIFQGSLDSSLTPLGYVQAKLLSLAFKSKKIDVIYSSFQKRALKTAIFLSKALNKEIIVEPRIREISFGELEGKNFIQMFVEHRDMMMAWSKDPLENPLPTQETKESFLKRVREFIDIVKAQKHEHIAVVSHGGFIHGFIMEATKFRAPLWNIHTDNTGVSKLRLAGDRFYIEYLNNTCHLL
jgi:probable phosphoglycerate mutase